MSHKLKFSHKDLSCERRNGYDGRTISELSYINFLLWKKQQSFLSLDVSFLQLFFLVAKN